MTAPTATDDILSQFELGERIARNGQSGQGIVVRAQRRSDGRNVVLKVYQDPHRPVDTWDEIEEATLGYQREIGFLERAKRDQRADVPVLLGHGVGGSLGQPVAVFEEIPGKTLEQLVMDAARPFGVQDIMHISKGVSETLEYAHTTAVRPIIHRDLNPSNIILRPDDTTVVIDWATAKAKTGVTQFGTQFYTQYFTAPEVMAGQPAGPSADVYSLGRVLQYAILGERFGEADGMPQHRDFSNINVPGKLLAALQRATNDDPDKRHQTITEFQADVDQSMTPVRIVVHSATDTRAHESLPTIAEKEGVSLRESWEEFTYNSRGRAATDIANAHTYEQLYTRLQTLAKTNPLIKQRLEGRRFDTILGALESERRSALSRNLRYLRFDREWREEYNAKVQNLAAIVGSRAEEGLTVWGLKEMAKGLFHRQDFVFTSEEEEKILNRVLHLCAAAFGGGIATALAFEPATPPLTALAAGVATTYVGLYGAVKLIDRKVALRTAHNKAKELDALVDKVIKYHDLSSGDGPEASEAARKFALNRKDTLDRWGNDVLTHRIAWIDKQAKYAVAQGTATKFEADEYRRQETTKLVNQLLAENAEYTPIVRKLLSSESIVEYVKTYSRRTEQDLHENPSLIQENADLANQLAPIMNYISINTYDKIKAQRFATVGGAAIAAGVSALAVAKAPGPLNIPETIAAVASGVIGAPIVFRWFAGLDWQGEGEDRQLLESLGNLQTWMHQYAPQDLLAPVTEK